MSDPHHPQSPDNKNDENDAGKRIRKPLFHMQENPQDTHFREWLLEKDIRIIFAGETHTVDYTRLDIGKFKACGPILKAVYIEYSNPKANPNTESGILRDIQKRRVEEWNPSSDDSYDEITAHLVEQDEMDKLQAFGCQGHRFTRETLEKAIAETEKGKVTIIMIGVAHLYAITDPELLDREFIGPPLGGSKNDSKENDANDEDGGAAAGDKTVIYKDAYEALKAEATFPGKVMHRGHTNNQMFLNHISSYGLVDYYAKKFDVGMMVSDGDWMGKKWVDFTDGTLGDIIIRNRSARQLTERHAARNNIYITKNSREWDPIYWKLVQENAQNQLFRDFDEGLKPAVIDALLDQIAEGYANGYDMGLFNKYKMKHTFWHYFTSFAPVFPDAPDPLAVINWDEPTAPQVTDHYDPEIGVDDHESD